MPKFDTRPTQVDIDHYAGDTLSIRINVDAATVNGRTWKAQVRSERTSATVAGEFDVLPDATGCTIMLESDICKTLAANGVYKGFWDVQVYEPVGGPDPVTTFAGGRLNIHPDVTRQL
jgi:hypothetical protein